LVPRASHLHCPSRRQGYSIPPRRYPRGRRSLNPSCLANHGDNQMVTIRWRQADAHSSLLCFQPRSIACRPYDFVTIQAQFFDSDCRISYLVMFGMWQTASIVEKYRAYLDQHGCQNAYPQSLMIPGFHLCRLLVHLEIERYVVPSVEIPEFGMIRAQRQYTACQ